MVKYSTWWETILALVILVVVGAIFGRAKYREYQAQKFEELREPLISGENH